MDSSQNQTNMLWYNYTPVENIISNTPVQVDVSNVDIARQLNQHVQIQYNGIHAVQAPHQIFVTASPSIEVEESHGDPLQLTSDAEVAEPKARVRSSGERVPCQICKKTFSCNANLRDHMRLHTGDRPFECSECNMKFAQRSNWRLHKRVHTGERPYMCGLCGKTFARSSHLPGHMRIHTKERPFSCDVCSRPFGSQQALKNHVRTHTGEKPFQCRSCNTSFTHSSSLSSHKKRCTGQKRKRGRPLGSGRKASKKKVSGRPRGRPKKTKRLGRPKKKDLVDEASGVSKEVMIKSEIKAEAFFDDEMTYNSPKDNENDSTQISSGDVEEVEFQANEIIISSDNLGGEFERKLCSNIMMISDDNLTENVINYDDSESKDEMNNPDDLTKASICHVVSKEECAALDMPGTDETYSINHEQTSSNVIKIQPDSDISVTESQEQGFSQEVKLCVSSSNDIFLNNETATLKTEDIVSQGTVAENSQENSLHQEAAVAMTVLQQGTSPQIIQGDSLSYLPTTTSNNSLWYSTSPLVFNNN